MTDHALTRSPSNFAHETSITGYVIDRYGGSITHSFAYQYALPMVRHESRAPQKGTNIIILRINALMFLQYTSQLCGF